MPSHPIAAPAEAGLAVSVVVTCYNLGGFLMEALHSIPPGCEVIVVDDGSTDPETVAVLDALDTEQYVVLRQPNLGLARARNNGIRIAKGICIIPLDADNRLRPAMVDRTLEILGARADVDIVHGDGEYFGERQGRWMVGPFDFALMIERNRIDACAGFRRSLWERVGGYDENMPVMGYEDWDFWLRCSVAGAAFHYVPEILFDYRVRGGSMLTETMRNRDQLVAYIFAKRELRFLAPLRTDYLRAMEREQRSRPLTGRALLGMAWSRLTARLRGQPAPPGAYIADQ
ncbi:MAG: glycosyltransferase [Flavobacteriales bacterium]|nr:glycosyltransferase [Flavobacteriales bacterium]